MPSPRSIAMKRQAAEKRLHSKLDFLIAQMGFICEEDEQGNLIFRPKEVERELQGVNGTNGIHSNSTTKRGRPKKTAPESSEESL